jgi:seryl-tRNA synthetase
MVFRKTLFDDDQLTDHPNELKKEVKSLEKLKSLEDKISTAIERVKTLKEEKSLSERRIKELEGLLDEKNQEFEQIRTEKNVIKSQLEALLRELDTLELEEGAWCHLDSAQLGLSRMGTDNFGVGTIHAIVRLRSADFTCPRDVHSILSSPCGDQRKPHGQTKLPVRETQQGSGEEK